MEFRRVIDLQAELSKGTCFLFGPRSVGKSFWIRKSLKGIKSFDLLDEDIYRRFLTRPRSLGSEISKANKIVVIDEIQRVPALLNEVHRLIETEGTKFLLTGSSARKLKRGGTNLLGGRARWLEMFPLVSKEIADFNLLHYLQRGGIPRMYLSSDPSEGLRSYTDLYLKEEIQAEAIVRRIDHFARFMDVVGVQSGQELNYQGIADDAGVPPRTVASFVEVLKDTLIAYEVEPYRKAKKRKVISRSKVYLFDVGVANSLAGRILGSLKGDSLGMSLEHFIGQELRAFLSYSKLRLPICYWRTTTQLEVDFVVGNQWALEVKGSSQVSERSFKGLKALREEGLIKNFGCISLDPNDREIDGVRCFSAASFLRQLWAGKLISGA